ncbi:MAG: UDP-N-acetylglucosamine 2-epimerase (non-hydrolyzing) [Clostridiales bacterium]|jgi:UDP-N-acetylglucosamine 2-epimerase|nr:UDP-N-acetylglucosamine 2-epimerase (non-hydrolyzing) [Clostridiales bacterium]
MIRVLSVFGTRPEAIKMAPLVRVLADSPLIDSKVVVTAQHREMLDSVLTIFGILPDFDLDIMSAGQDLAEITTKALNGLMGVIERLRPDLVLVHGDTTTTLAASLAAYYSGVCLGHVEAGLRTHDKYAPFPEEINRRVAGVCADLHFAPTEAARANLLAENVDPKAIFVTGNTSIDAAAGLVRPNYKFKEQALNSLDFSRRILTLTAHRRENHGQPLREICRAALRIGSDFPDAEIVYPVHPSPAVSPTVHEILGKKSGIHLVNPLDIEDMHNLMARSHLVLTDSGGLQEEAPHHNVPVVVLRRVTERPEGVEAGCLVVAGNGEQSVYKAVAELLTDSELHARMSKAENPFGDGFASQRILSGIMQYFVGATALGRPNKKEGFNRGLVQRG